MPREKNYYKILGIEQTATPEQIKEAYREKAKKHHPDVVGGAAPDAEVFRDLMEAYGVLSVKESRVNYDLMMRKTPNDYQEISQADFDKTFGIEKRDEAGNTPVSSPKVGSYAEERHKELK